MRDRAMLLGATAGMALGLWLDARAAGLATLASLCLGSPRDLAGVLALHLELLPGMHLGMLAGALAGCWLDRRGRTRPMLADSLIGLAWMVGGMTSATLALASLAGPAAGPSVMLAAMLAGMGCGMAAAGAIGRFAPMRAKRLRQGFRG